MGDLSGVKLSAQILVEWEWKCCTESGHSRYYALGNHLLLISLVLMLSKDTDEADAAGRIRQPHLLS